MQKLLLSIKPVRVYFRETELKNTLLFYIARINNDNDLLKPRYMSGLFTKL